MSAFGAKRTFFVVLLRYELAAKIKSPAVAGGAFA
jgi:hypothetical protein